MGCRAGAGYAGTIMGLALLLTIAAVLVCILAVAGLLHALSHPPRKTYAVALGRGQPTEPEAAGLVGEAATLTLSDQTTTPAWLVRGEDPAGPTVLIVHGFGDSRYGALTWAAWLAPYAPRLVAYDQRGQGESAARRSTLGVREVDDVLAVMDQLHHSDQGAGRIVLFGYSMGATVAIAAAARAGDRVAGVIADGPYRFWHEPVGAELRRRRYPGAVMLSLARLLLWLSVSAIRRFDRVAYARQVNVPMLVLHGTEDAICRIEAAHAIAEAAPQGELVVFEGGGHLDLATLEPGRYRAALARFFERISTAESGHEQAKRSTDDE